eukprot:13645123-Alexandrium_andersonii.AAC.1
MFGLRRACICALPLKSGIDFVVNTPLACLPPERCVSGSASTPEAMVACHQAGNQGRGAFGGPSLAFSSTGVYAE